MAGNPLVPGKHGGDLVGFVDFLQSRRIDRGIVHEFDGGREEANGRLVTGNYFQTLDVEPLVGRTFTAEEDRVPGSNPVVVISYGYWRTRFSGGSGAPCT